MDGLQQLWAIFWICLFSYLAIKYTVNAFTYDKNKALKEIVKEESSKKIDDELEKFLGDFEITDEDLEKVVEKVSNFKYRERKRI